METKNSLISERLGTAPVGKLLFFMSAPAILSMLVQALYNVVDSIFVARISQNALTALTLSFPMQLFLISVALGIGVGTNSLVSRRLGEGKNFEAGEAAQTGLFIALVCGAAFVVIAATVPKWFIGLFTDIAEIREMGFWYLSIVLGFGMCVFVDMCLTRTMQAMSVMLLPMISQIIGAVVNIILDPIMIFGLLGFPALGIKGAAIATVIGQICSMTFSICVIAFKKFDIRIFFDRFFKIKKRNLRDIARVALPTFILNALSAVLNTGLNAILIGFSTTAVAVYGVYFRLDSFVFMPCFGINQGLMPILGYNYGANNRARFKKAYMIANTAAFIIMFIGTAFFMTIPDKLLLLFNANAEMLAIGVPALRIISICFMPASFDIIMVSMFSAIGHGMKALLISLLRQIGILLPAAFLLGKFLGIYAFWFAYPISDVLTVAVFLPVTILTVRKIFNRKDASAVA